MTEASSAEIQSTGNNLPDSTVSTTSVATQTPTEKMVPQSAVDKAVKHALVQGEERALKRLQQQQQPSQGFSAAEASQTQYTTPQSQQPQYNQVDASSIAQIIDSRLNEFDKKRQSDLEQKQREAQANQLISDFARKIDAGKDKYSDFEEVVTGLNLPTVPNLVPLANSVDNVADVMYELASNPLKAKALNDLAQINPHAAMKEMSKLSNSLKQNESATSQPRAYEPLSQIKPSTTGTDNGSSTISDLRKQSWLRG